MSKEFKIGSGERDIIDYFIEHDNKMDWISNISKNIKRKNGKIGKDISGVQKYVEELESKEILKKHDCPPELFKNRERGGSKPRDCYTLNYDMKPEWFQEIAKPYLDSDDGNIRKDFVHTLFVNNMVRSRKFIDWLVENHLNIQLDNERRHLLPMIFMSFPSTFRWVLFGDISVIDEFIPPKLKKEIPPEATLLAFFSFINSLIVTDIINRTADLRYGGLVSIMSQSHTEMDFFNIGVPMEDGSREMIQLYASIPGFISIQRKDIKIERPGFTEEKCPKCNKVLMWIFWIDRYYCEKCDQIIKESSDSK